MTDDWDFTIRPGRIRSSRAQSARPFIAQALAAARKAGGDVSRSGRIVPGNRSRFGKGQRASLQANRFITARSRGAVIKARVVRHSARTAPLGTHLAYLRREGVTRDGEKARLFGPEAEGADGPAFAERCEEDRHHFRFIVSPDDALEMSDLRAFTSDLAHQMEKDLGTRLDWVAVDHWNTEHPHVHLIVRGVRDDGQDLVIARDYIKDGMRDRARDLITQELGPRNDRDIRRTVERQVEAERWTQLDRQLVRDARETGIIDTLFVPYFAPDEPGSATFSGGNDSGSFNNTWLNDAASGNLADVQRSVLKYIDPAVTTVEEAKSLSRGPNRACPTPIAPLSRDLSKVRDGINAMKYWNGSGTNIAEGLTWGWRVVTPDALYTEASAHDPENVSKFVVLMTDGRNVSFGSSCTMNKSDYGCYGFLADGRITGTSSQSQAEKKLNEWTLEVCQKMKEQQIEIFTVLYKETNKGVQDMLRSCASKPTNFHMASNTAGLEAAFSNIGRDMSPLRLIR